MRIVVAALLVISLSGCAAQVFQVPLSLPDTGKVKFNLKVGDERLDRQIYMTGISFGSASHIYLLTAEPPIEVALERYIHNATSKVMHQLSFTKAEVAIEELDLKNKVGFAKADELYCKIESKVVIYSETAKPLERRVKTFTKNEKNMSPMIVTSAKTILDECLQQHAVDVADSIGTSR